MSQIDPNVMQMLRQQRAHHMGKYRETQQQLDEVKTRQIKLMQESAYHNACMKNLDELERSYNATQPDPDQGDDNESNQQKEDQEECHDTSNDSGIGESAHVVSAAVPSSGRASTRKRVGLSADSAVRGGSSESAEPKP